MTEPNDSREIELENALKQLRRARKIHDILVNKGIEKKYDPDVTANTLETTIKIMESELADLRVDQAQFGK